MMPGRSETHIQAGSLKIRTAAFLLLLALPSPLPAQYFDPDESGPPVSRFIFAGGMQRTFEPRATNGTPDSASIFFDKVMPFIGIHQALFDVMFGYSKFTLRGQSREAIFFGALFSNDIVLSGRGSRGGVTIPVMLAADFTKCENTGVERESFNIASVGIGAGLQFRHITSSFELSVHAAEIAHFSFEGLSTGTGFSAATIAEISCVFRRALVLDGITAGYRFRYQTWSMSEQKFNYSVLSHGPYIGVLF